MKVWKLVAIGVTFCGLLLGWLVLPSHGDGSATQSATASEALVFIDVPGAKMTVARAINAAGDITGFFLDKNEIRHGFLLRQGKYTKFDYPGADGTAPMSINDNGLIAGNYGIKTGTFSFTRTREGAFQTAGPSQPDAPGKKLVLTGVNNSGTLIGARIPDYGGITELVRLENGAARVLGGLPMGSSAGGINTAGVIVGSKGAGSSGQRIYGDGFLLRDGMISAFRFPGSDWTFANGINDQEEIVGTFRTAENEARCFYRSAKGKFSELVFADARTCDAQAINNAGVVLVRYWSKSESRLRNFYLRPGATVLRAAADVPPPVPAPFAGVVRASAAPSTPAPTANTAAAQAPTNKITVVPPATAAPQQVAPQTSAEPTVTNTSASVNIPEAEGEVITLQAEGKGEIKPKGINSRGEIVGNVESDRSAFLWQNGTFTFFQYPESERTGAQGISDDGLIVGNFLMRAPSGGSFVGGYTRTREGSIQVLLPPDYNFGGITQVIGISGRGDIYHDAARKSRAHQFFRFAYGKYNDMGIVEDAALRGGNANGVSVGVRDLDLFVKGDIVGFELRDGVMKQFRVPGASQTEANGINDRGTIVGSYRDEHNAMQCYFRDAAGRFYKLKIPNANACEAAGINNDGIIVGTYTLAGRRGFAWHPRGGNSTSVTTASAGSGATAKAQPAPQPTVAPKQEAAPPNAVAVQPSARNSAATVAPVPSTPTVAPAPALPAMLMRVSAGTDLVKIAVPGASTTRPAGMNSSGDVVGSYEDGQHNRGFLFRQGKFILIDFPGAESTFPVAINDSGVVAGIYDGKSGIHSFIRSAAGVFRTVSFHDENGKPNSMIDIYGITNSGAVWGSEVKTNDHTAYLLEGTGQRVLYRFKAGSQLKGMNSNGTMIGEMLSEDGPNGSIVGFMIRSGNLSTFRYPGVNETFADGINDHEDVVGTFVDADRNAGCFRRNKNGEMAQLVIPGAYICVARQINNVGDVAGEYTLRGSGETIGFRWHPGKGELVQLANAPAKQPVPPAAAQPVTTSAAERPARPAPPPSTYYSRVSMMERRGSLLSPASGSYSPLQDSLHTQIQPHGLNSAGEVVGYSPDYGEGFIWRQGRFEFFREDKITLAKGISDAGLVAGETGSVSLSGYATFFVFIRSGDGSVRKVPLPYGTKASPHVTCVNSAGHVFATVTGDDYVDHFIRVNPGPSSQVDVLKTFDNLQCANSSGVGVGYGAFLHSGPESGPSGYTVENGAATYFAVPNSTSTRAMSINDRGDVVGDYVDEYRVRRCFLRHSSGDFAEIKIGESTDCYAAAINNDGVVVGTYTLKGGVYPIGFIWYPSGSLQTASGGAPPPPRSGQASSGGASGSTETALEEAELDSMIGLAQKYLDISSFMKSIKSGNFGQALQVLDQSNAAIRQSLNSADPALNRPELRAALSALLWIRAQTYDKLGRQDLMINALTEATQITPSAKAFTALCRAQSVATQGRDYLSLLPSCTRAIELNPDGADPYFHRGGARALSDAVVGRNSKGLLKLSDSAESDLVRYLSLAPEGIHAAEARYALSKAGKQ